MRLSDSENKSCRLKGFQTAWTIQVDVVPIKQRGRQQRRKLFFTSERCFGFNDARNRHDFPCEFQRCLQLKYAKSYIFNNVICD